MISLETERLLLRKWNESKDLPFLLEFFSNETYSHFVGGPKRPEAIFRLMASYIGHYVLRGYSFWAVEDKATCDCIGAVGLWNSPEWPEIELGYYLHPNSQGKGLATEAAKTCKKYAFEKLHLPTLVSYIDPQNVASKRVAEKLGASYTETIDLAQFGPHEVFRYPKP